MRTYQELITVNISVHKMYIHTYKKIHRQIYFLYTHTVTLICEQVKKFSVRDSR